MMLSTASPPRQDAVSSPGAGSPGIQPVQNAATAQMLAPLSAAAYFEMASRALAQPPNEPPLHHYALAAAAYQERQQQLFSAMCGAVLGSNSAPNPLAAMLSNPAAAAALMAPHLMAACFREEPKPPHSYIGLIAMAILSSPEKKMVLSDIYQWILDHYPYFRTRGPGWRNSIRHNLSLNDCFVKVGRSANGKGHFWAIHPANLSDFQRGDFRRKKAQKRIKKHMGIIDNDDDDDDECMQQLVMSDEDDAPNAKTSPPTSAKSSSTSMSMSPVERFSEFLLMKNQSQQSDLNDPVAMAARLAMRLSAAPGFALPLGTVPTNGNGSNNGPSSSNSNSPVEVVVDDDEARHRHLNNALINQQLLDRLVAATTAVVASPNNSASKKRRIFDIDSLLAPTS